MILTNFKTYEYAMGEKALAIAKIHEEVARETGVEVLVAPQTLDLRGVCQSVKIPVVAQHIDPAGLGKWTGHVPPEAAKDAGAWGTLLNHSERRLSRETLAASIRRAKAAGLKVIVCATTAQEGAGFLEFDPDFVAVEPPELIGGDISVSTAEPRIIQEAVKLIGRGKLLVGAGVKNGTDVRIALELGAKGVLLASGMAQTKDPRAVLMDLASGFTSPRLPQGKSALS